MIAHLQHYLSASLSLLGSGIPIFGTRALTRALTPDDFEARCNAFVPETYVSNSTRRIVEYVPAGTNLSLLDEDASCGRSSQVAHVDLCRIALSICTSPTSSIEMETWLPQSWSGRFLGTGNGGIGGCIKYEDLAYGSRLGFATTGSNNGHGGNTAVPLYQDPEGLIDFSWRALHTSVVAGKALVLGFYGQPHTRSYYIGCSLGGRQGINAADNFLSDFDGIVAGAPAVDFNNLVSWRAHFFPITGRANHSHFIEASTWTTLIHDEVLRQCDKVDGVNDGIIEHPSLCNFRPEALTCTTDRGINCLTPIQVETVRRIFSPMRSKDGRIMYPAMQPGSEVSAARGLFAGRPFRYSEEWFKYVVYDPSWDPSTFDLRDAYMAESLNPADVKAWPNDLSGFNACGGKIIVYHGSQDDKITSFNTERFYRHLARGTDMSSGQLDEFFRFFRISGMNHCHQGPGAWAFGQDGTVQSGAVPFTRENNVLAAIIDWVEQGIAPETIEGIKFINDTADFGVSFRRRHCRYPFQNRYLGGDSKVPNNWHCRRADKDQAAISSTESAISG